MKIFLSILPGSFLTLFVHSRRQTYKAYNVRCFVKTRLLMTFLTVCIGFYSFSQPKAHIDSLHRVLQKSAPDTNRVHVLTLLAELHFFTKPDTCVKYASKAYDLANKIGFERSKVPLLNMMGEATAGIAHKIQNAVMEKKKLVHSSNGNDEYEPTVEVSTKRTADTVIIAVKDNGSGIPSKVFDKIFQPFFTTKPAGQGTGLGLSLSYDIITKGHGGELKGSTIKGEGTEFVIQLPAGGSGM